MATRMYMWFDNTPPTVSVTKSSIWEYEATNSIRQFLRKTIPTTTNAGGTYTFTGSEADAAVNDTMCGQFLSLPMPPQQISGTVHGLWSGRQAAADYGLGTQLVIRVVSNDGSVVRGTVYSQHTYSTTVTTAGATNRSFPTGTTRTTRFLPGGTGSLTSLFCYTGDRLVVEIGVRATNTVATARVIDPRLQLRSDFADGALTEDLSGSNFNHWIEFSSDLTFDGGLVPQTFKGWGIPIR